MTAQPVHRQPPGSPVGGRFAPSPADAPSLSLVAGTSAAPPRPAGAEELYDLGPSVLAEVRRQVPDAVEVRLEVAVGEEANYSNPANPREVPVFAPDLITVVDAAGTQHDLDLTDDVAPGVFDDLDVAMREAAETRRFDEGDVAYLDLVERENRRADDHVYAPYAAGFDDPAPF